jgi:uncharacterized protein YjbI with pentapeptide repeats
MTDCSLVGADFYQAVLKKGTPDGRDLRDSDFSKASVQGLQLRRSQLEGVRGAQSLEGVVVTGDQVLPLALSLFSALSIEIRNDEP